MPGVLPWHDFLDAEIVVTSEFIRERLEVCLGPDDLDSWSHALGTLAAGRDVAWMDDGRDPEIRFEPSGQDGGAVVVVADVGGSGTSIWAPVRLADGWADEHYERLQRVRTTWSQEVVESSPGACEWRR